MAVSCLSCAASVFTARVHMHTAKVRHFRSPPQLSPKAPVMPAPEVLGTIQHQRSEQRPRSADASISVKKVPTHRSTDHGVTVAPAKYVPSQPVHLVSTQSVRVTWNAKVETMWGDQVLLVGSSPQLGEWNPSQTSVELRTDKATYPTWTATVDLEAAGPVEYKVVVVRASRSQHASHTPLFEWEPIDNRTLSRHAHHAGKAAHVDLTYAQPGGSVSWRWEW